MKTKFFIVILSSILAISLISAEIRDGNCLAGETCMFSMYKMNNSHAGECNFYNYSVCYPESINITLRNGSCNASENFILSFFKPNDTHVSVNPDFYNYSICVQGTTCGIDTVRDYAIVTLYRLNNSHVGDINYFSHTLYCGNLTPVTPPPSAGGGISTKIPKPPKIIIEKVPEIIVEVVTKIPIYMWFFITFLFILGWRRKRKYRSLKRKVKKEKSQEKEKQRKVLR